MDSKNILTADLLDLVFDNRNKDYGAYELRRFYNRRIGKAIVITATLVGVTITSLAFANKMNPEKQIAEEDHIVTITELPPDEKIPDPVIPQQQPAPQQIEQIQTEKFTAYNIVDNNEVVEPPVAQDDLKASAIGLVAQEGVEDKGLEQGPAIIGQGKGIIEEQAPKDEGPVTDVQVQAKYIGNWEKFLLRYLNGNIPVDNGAAPGRYTVMIQFVVDVDGSVSDVRPMTNLGFGMEQEAIRVLKKATKWEPAFQNGRQVKAYRKQPITFVVSEE